jgi:thymidylate synthase ThyX
MSYSAKVVADSIGPSGVRLLSVLCVYPLMVHAEHLRHRSFGFSVASNRAIPTRLILRQVIDDPVVPVWFGKNQGGMSAREELSGWRRSIACHLWLLARWSAVIFAWLLLRVGLHKQIANRILSPWQWVTVLVTGTEWENFFALRCHPDAQPEMRKAAEMIRDAIDRSNPHPVNVGDWHLPFVSGSELWDLCVQKQTFEAAVKEGEREACLSSAARCARISAVRHEERRSPKDEIAMAEKLMKSGHMSPFEHQAQALSDDRRCANLRGWRSFRSTIPNEENFAKLTQQVSQ